VREILSSVTQAQVSKYFIGGSIETKMESSPRISKILVVGSRGAGKTSLLCRLIFDSVEQCEELEGQFQKFTFSRNDGSKISFLFKEVSVLPATEKKAGYILVLDSNSKSDLATLPNVISMISDRKFIIALTKADLHYSAEFWVEDVKNVLHEDRINVIPVSAKTGQNIPELLNALSEMVTS
jgi:GTPase SAR1 family protein